MHTISSALPELGHHRTAQDLPPELVGPSWNAQVISRRSTEFTGTPFVSVHAFVDESARNQHYLLCAVVIDPAHLKAVRQELRGLLLPGQRELHFSHEKPTRRRLIADRIARLPVAATIYRASCTPKTQEKARQQCIGRCVRDLLHQRAHRLVLDSREHRDANDRGTIYRELGPQPSAPLTHEHASSRSVPLLWIPDAVAWCYGVGGHWRRRVGPIVTTITDV